MGFQNKGNYKLSSIAHWVHHRRFGVWEAKGITHSVESPFFLSSGSGDRQVQAVGFSLFVLVLLFFWWCLGGS
jgi:hypothetical protein